MMLRRKNQRGAAMVEYGLLVALIALVVLISVTTLGTSINGAFQRIGTAVGAATPAPAGG